MAKKVTDIDWKSHDIYEDGVSSSRIVTRSQTALLRIENSKSNLDLFANPSKHQPPGQPHLIEVLKGKYGAVPRTIITRNFGEYIKLDKDLEKKLDTYKQYKPAKNGKVKIKKEKTAEK
ncbi:hypothetical protein JTE90_027511 [Oedothorax gibbosus]|uniref:Uncharacterized protein n=1 Tax=Oedothorax gibbosus TaxID=931172 RepID=A0AAV6VL51_9ARAC|nr:hypothetical protein JTE90_027511 [Oedothorax gibbosus]